ncbi:MAG: hypothetical protein ABFS35_19615 [Bacteroidota bacterium]
MRKFFVLFIISIFAINSCGPTLESSNEDWKRNQEAITQLKTDFATFTPLIDQKLEEAKKVWDAAQNISNEEEKLDKMVEANKVLSSGTIGNLRNMKSKISGLKNKKESLMKMKVSSYQLEDRTQDAFETVKKAIKKAETVIYMSKDEFNIDEAPGKLNLAFNGLTDAYREVEIIIDLIDEENNKIAEEKQKKEQQIEEEKVKEEKAKADIKCSYCGTMNKAGSTKCSSCGGPFEKK